MLLKPVQMIILLLLEMIVSLLGVMPFSGKMVILMIEVCLLQDNDQGTATPTHQNGKPTDQPNHHSSETCQALTQPPTRSPTDSAPSTNTTESGLNSPKLKTPLNALSSQKLPE